MTNAVRAVRCRIIALHGFLGSTADWETLRPFLPWAALETVDLWDVIDRLAPPAEAGLAPGGRPWEWEAVGRALGQRLQDATRRDQRIPTILVAYSFGARLALAVPALATGQVPLKGVCLVSCNPGLSEDDVSTRTDRRRADERWVRMLLEEAEESIRQAWEAQPVLAAVPAAPRTPRAMGLPAPRPVLARAMRAFSLAGQPDFRARLRAWRTSLVWVTGEADAKFESIARRLKADGIPARFVSCPGAGHRVPWDNPEGFGEILREMAESKHP